MRLLLSALLLWLTVADVSAENLFKLTATDVEKKFILPLSEFQGKAVLVVDTACCECTPQYKAMEEVVQKYQNQVLVVLVSPSNDFYHELSSNEEIKEFCKGY